MKASWTRDKSAEASRPAWGRQYQPVVLHADGRREIVWGAPLFSARDARFYAVRYIARHYVRAAVQS